MRQKIVIVILFLGAESKVKKTNTYSICFSLSFNDGVSRYQGAVTLVSLRRHGVNSSPQAAYPSPRCFTQFIHVGVNPVLIQ